MSKTAKLRITSIGFFILAALTLWAANEEGQRIETVFQLGFYCAVFLGISLGAEINNHP